MTAGGCAAAVNTSPNGRTTVSPRLQGGSARGWILRHGYGLLEMWEFDSPRAVLPAESRKVNEFGWAHISLMVDDMPATYEALKDQLF